MQTQIRLLLKEQSDLGLHCLPFHVHFFGCIKKNKLKLFSISIITLITLGFQVFFRIFTGESLPYNYCHCSSTTFCWDSWRMQHNGHHLIYLCDTARERHETMSVERLKNWCSNEPLQKKNVGRMWYSTIL